MLVVLPGLLMQGGCGFDSRIIGAACTDELDCGAGSICRTGSRFPGNVCTVTCSEDFGCRAGASCVDLEGGMCLRDCETDEDCERDGYTCQDVTARRVAGTVRVCIGG